MKEQNIWVMIPTYNEAENIERLIQKIISLDIQNLDILVVDDNSPDETWKIVESLTKKYRSIHLLRRCSDKGRGRAGIAGFKYCLDHEADIIIEMDADFSHDPKHIPSLIAALGKVDLALGSRRVPGGEDIGRALWRRIVTRYANLYIRLLTGMDIYDCNSGFRAMKANVLQDVSVQNFTSIGPSVVQELLFKAHLKGFVIIEIPIIFHDRQVGASKLTWKEMVQGYKFITLMKWKHIIGKL